MDFVLNVCSHGQATDSGNSDDRYQQSQPKTRHSWPEHSEAALAVILVSESSENVPDLDITGEKFPITLIERGFMRSALVSPRPETPTFVMDARKTEEKVYLHIRH